MGAVVKGKLKLQPLTGMFLLISVSVFSFAENDFKTEVAVFLILIGLSCGSGLLPTAVKSAAVYAVLQVLKFVVFPVLPDVLTAHLGLFVVHAPKLIPIYLVGQMLIKTNPVRKIMFALRKIHVPESLTIPLAIGIRYFPSLREERRAISDAVKLRGIKGIRKITFGIMPLVVTASDTADELAQAITVRGIENPSRKTFVEDMTARASDHAVRIFALGLLLIAIFR